MTGKPFWILLFPFTDTTIPAHGQFVSVALVALFSDVIATSLFLSARKSADDANQLAAVDATQSSEAIFALVGEEMFLLISLPNLMGTLVSWSLVRGLLSLQTMSKTARVRNTPRTASNLEQLYGAPISKVIPSLLGNCPTIRTKVNMWMLDNIYAFPPALCLPPSAS